MCFFFFFTVFKSKSNVLVSSQPTQKWTSCFLSTFSDDNKFYYIPWTEVHVFSGGRTRHSLLKAVRAGAKQQNETVGLVALLLS